ncbi:hypothetical protein EI983_17345 [Roseovarius faecimaris]|uniref:Uncharacterized protein n=2 Tax=Roseovarius faecimaris TaxID=2494550 RepID=A0A6I6IWT8_9RHOB|nr:hypothetical protein EI983_17345 [Roseovarius faecimaris]
MILWILLRSLPPVSWGRLLMPAVFVGSWTGLCALGLEQPAAFVWSAVLAQAAHLYAVLPVSAVRQRRLFGRARTAMWGAVLVCLGLFALQIWLLNPVVTHRLVSLYGALYLGVTLLGLCGDRVALDRLVPVGAPSEVPLPFRHHLLRLYALTVFLVIVVNESLLIAHVPLGARVAILSVLPVVLHYLFEIMLRLTCPPLEDGPG